MISRKYFLEAFFVLASILVLLFFSYKPIYENFQKAPTDMYYLGSVDYPLDLTGTLAVVQEGYKGHWTRMPKATSTIEGKETLLKFEYIIVGQLARVFHTDPVFMYFLSRFLISLGFLLSIYFVISSIFQSFIQRIIAYLICLYATGVINPIQGMGIMHRLPYDALVFQRFTMAAHHYLLSGLFCFLSIYFLAKAIDGKRRKYILIASILGFLSTFIHPAAMLLVIISLPIYLVLKSVRTITLHEHFDFIKKELLILFIYTVASLVPLVYFRYVTQFWDFNALSKTEHIVPFTIAPWEYIQSIGLVYIFSLIAYIPIVRSGKTFFMLLIPWVVVHPLSIFVISQIVGVNSMRFFLIPYFLIFSLLAAVGIFAIGRKFKNSLVVLFFTIVIFFSGFYSYETSVIANRVCFCMIPSVYDYGYPKKEIVDVLLWLRHNTEEKNIVLSGFYAGTLIPAFSGNYVFTSWWHYIMNPVNLPNTASSVSTFYAGMSDQNALAFLQKNHISYVYFGVAERQFAGNRDGLSYSFLKEVTRSNQTILYEVQP